MQVQSMFCLSVCVSLTFESSVIIAEHGELIVLPNSHVNLVLLYQTSWQNPNRVTTAMVLIEVEYAVLEICRFRPVAGCVSERIEHLLIVRFILAHSGNE